MSATDTTTRPRGRQFFANPGPTNIPDSVLQAVAHHTVDFNDPAFMEVYEACFEGLKRVLKTRRGQLFMYTGSGHAAWEASLVNLFSPGDVVLIPETGHFSDTWATWPATWGSRYDRSRRIGGRAWTWRRCGRRSRPTRAARSRRSAPSTTRPRPA